jgi:hypothetical protein
VLGEHLVGGAHAGQHARARVRDVEDLEQFLHRAVLAVPSVHRDERDIRRGVTKPVDEILPHVERHHLVAQALERILHARA